MAYERATTTTLKGGEGLDTFVDGKLKQFSTQIAVRNAEQEYTFSKAVVEQDLSLDDQLAFRQSQLKVVSDDPDERKRVRNEITSLKERVVQKKFSDDYTSKLLDFESGISSIDSVVDWLKNARSATNN